MAEEIKKSLLITLEFPPQHGGVGNYYYNVAKNLPSDKIVVLAATDHKTAGFDRQQKFPIIRLPKLTAINQTIATGGRIGKLIGSLKWLSLNREIKRIAKNHKIELIQVGQILPLGTVALMLNRQQNLPYIIYTHGLDILLPQKFRRKKIILKKIISQAKGIIANSHFTQDELLELGAAAEKIITVNPCPNLANQEVSEWKINEIRETYGLKNKKILLTVGRLVKRKGHDMVIESLPLILKRVPNLIYLIIGDGPELKNLETKINQKGLRDKVRFLTHVTTQELPAFYSLCDVFIMPARQIGPDVEGFGIVYLEANLFGKPVIAGRGGGVTDAVIDKKTGLLVDPKNPAAIAEAAINLLTTPALSEKLGLQGMDRTIEKFNWENQVEKIKQILF